MFLFVSQGLAGLGAALDYQALYEVPERLRADGQVHYPLDEEALVVQLLEAKALGAQTIDLALMHSVAYPRHAQVVQQLAQQMGLKVRLQTQLCLALQTVEANFPVLVARYHRSATQQECHWLALDTLAAQSIGAPVEHLLRAAVLKADGRLFPASTYQNLHLQPNDRLCEQWQWK